MCFARIGPETDEHLNRIIGHRQSLRRVIDPCEIELIVSVSKLVMCKGKVLVAFHRFAQQANGFKEVISLRRVEHRTGDERLAANV